MFGPDNTYCRFLPGFSYGLRGGGGGGGGYNHQYGHRCGLEGRKRSGVSAAEKRWILDKHNEYRRCGNSRRDF